MKFSPLHHRVVVKRIDAEIKLPRASSSLRPPRRSRSKVKFIAVGPGGRDEAGKLLPIDV